MKKTAVVRASELYRAGGKVLKRVVVGHEHVVVERDGYPVAVMLPYPEYKDLMHDQAEEPDPGAPVAAPVTVKRQGSEKRYGKTKR